MAYKRGADGIAKKGKTDGKNLGNDGPTVAAMKGKGSKGASGVTSLAMKKMGRNMARAMNQKGG